MIEIGLITTTHGIKGELKIKSLSDFDRFTINEVFFIIYDDEKITLTVERAREHKNQIIVKFKEYNNINDVIPFRGLTIYSKSKGKLKRNEHYVTSLIDLLVYTDKDIYVGKVNDVIELPHGHLLEVKSEVKRVLIPFEKAFIKEVLEDKIIITPIEGLL